MKLIIFLNTIIYDRVISGADILTLNLIKRWVNRFDIEFVITQAAYSAVKGLEPKDKLKLKTLPSFYPKIPVFMKTYVHAVFISLALLLRGIYACFALWNLRGAKSKTILYTSSDYICDILPAFFLSLNNRKFVWIARVYHVILPPKARQGSFIMNTFSYYGQRISFWIIKRGATKIVTLSGTYSELVDLKFPENRMSISNAGVDFDVIDKVQASGIKYDAVFLARLHPSKGIRDLLKVWKLVTQKKKDAKLAVIGGGPEHIVNSLKKRILDYALESNIDLLGFLPTHEEVYTVMKSSKVYINLEEEDGWSMSGSEAMACGLPVIAYDLKMFHSAFKKGFIVVPLHDTQRFADTVLEILKNDARRCELSKEAREESENFDWDKIALELSKAMIK